MNVIATSARASLLASPLVRLVTPDHHYLETEPITVLIHPPDAPRYEVIVRTGRDESKHELPGRNRLELKTGLPIGEHDLRARALRMDHEWSPWSVPMKIFIHAARDEAKLQSLRTWEHRASLICERDSEGLLTLTDPWAFPPSYEMQVDSRATGVTDVDHIERGGWFRTPVYEGSTTLINEDAEYFRNPLEYLLSAIDALKICGAQFLTWHDVLANVTVDPLSIILQLDVDAGRNSLARILPVMIERGITGTLMVHREAHDWYEYRVEEMPLGLLKTAEHAGWVIGYHCNAIGNAQRIDRLGDYSNDVLSQATDLFRSDVHFLQQHFNVRTWTAHGGNVLNHMVPPPADVDLQCVDKGHCTAWNRITSMFSDGGFASRPKPLAQTVRSLRPGTHFFRIHPVKYGNYIAPWDVPPLVENDVEALGLELTANVRHWITDQRARQSRWLALRDQHRIAIRPSHMSIDKPLSRSLLPIDQDRAHIDRFRARRKLVFLREYPDPAGDPRVFWWRLLRTFAPSNGELLNVGALHPENRDETTAFLNSAVRVVEMDIDESRSPHIVGDITQPSIEMLNRFSGVLLFGLAYVHSPGVAIDACGQVVRTDGIGIFGFPDDSHPLRGSMWNAVNRPAWRRELEPLANIGLKGNLWCFQRDQLNDLFHNWMDVRIENFSHYWFVVARRQP